MTKTKEEVKNVIKISKSALIKEYPTSFFLKMPSVGEYEGYTYTLPKQAFRVVEEADDNSGTEEYYEITVYPKSLIALHHTDKKGIYIPFSELKEIVENKDSSNYPKNEPKKTKWISLSIDSSDRLKAENGYGVFKIQTGEYAGYTYILKDTFVKNEDPDTNKINAYLPIDFEITITNKKEDISKKISPSDLLGYIKEANEKKSEVTLPFASCIKAMDDYYIFSMPKGEYEDNIYFVSKKYVKEEKNNYVLTLDKEKVINMKNRYIIGAKREKLDFETYKSLVDGNDESSYVTYVSPKEIRKKIFESYEKLLDKNVPSEMKEKNKWVCVKIRENKENSRYDKFLINPNDGSFAKIDDSSTWTNYEKAKEFARENACTTLAFALDKSDEICCLDLDKCIDENDEASSFAKQFLDCAKNTYVEKSISSKGYHIFFKAKDNNYKTFSENGECEYYQNSHFISLTGNSNEVTKLKDLGASKLSKLIESSFEKRDVWKGEKKGESGLTILSDHELIKKASESRGGEEFKALYNGVDLKNNHSNSDMALMVRLAYFSNNDINQMLRIFATSGLYREKKSKEYYEGTAIKAIRMTPVTYNANYKSTNIPLKKTENERMNVKER